MFLNKLQSDGLTNIGFFFDSKSENYFIYHKKFNDLETAKKALQSKDSLSYNGNTTIVKVEN